MQPAVGLAWHATPAQTWRLAWGRAAEAPTLTELAYRTQGSGFNADLRAQHGRQVEAGWEMREGERREGEKRIALTAFHAETRDEISVLSNSGGRTVYTNAASTRRNGLEAAAQLPLAREWHLDLAATRLLTRVQPAGQPLPGVPAAYGSAELRWEGSGLDASLGVQARADWRWRVRADNLLDKVTAASVIVNESNRRYFEPAAPRGWSASLSWQPR